MENAQSVELIPFNQMKDIIEKELAELIENRKTESPIMPPIVTFEQGKTKISFSLPYINDSLLVIFIEVIKNYLYKLLKLMQKYVEDIDQYLHDR